MAALAAGAQGFAAEPDVGIVHDWFPQMSGGERVVAEMAKAFPCGAIYGLFDFLTEAERREIAGDRPIETSRLDRLPLVEHYYRSLLLPCTRAVEEFDLRRHDVVLSSSAALAKGVLTAPGQPHVAYIHSPARYAWDMTHAYLSGLCGPFAALKRRIARRMLHRFRLWDMRTPPSIDLMLANSAFIARRIRKVYGREARVLHPPVRTGVFTPGTEARESHYLTASRLVSYKRIDLIVQAFASMPDRRLIVIGDGPEMARIRAVAGRNVELLGHQPEAALIDHLRRARAFVFAAEEDFGIAPVEAQSCGTPVIAPGFGGTAETIRPLGGTTAPTGVWFGEQSVASLTKAIARFERNADRFDPVACRDNALRFSAGRFRRDLRQIVMEGLEHGFSPLAPSRQVLEARFA
jgi:glycosyltransferase involved in cell wall biosynthesis